MVTKTIAILKFVAIPGLILLLCLGIIYFFPKQDWPKVAKVEDSIPVYDYSKSDTTLMLPGGDYVVVHTSVHSIKGSKQICNEKQPLNITDTPDCEVVFSFKYKNGTIIERSYMGSVLVEKLKLSCDGRWFFLAPIFLGYSFTAKGYYFAIDMGQCCYPGYNGFLMLDGNGNIVRAKQVPGGNEKEGIYLSKDGKYCSNNAGIFSFDFSKERLFSDSPHVVVLNY